MGDKAKNRVRNSDSVILFSGGMDSQVAWEYLGRPDRLYVRLGHRYEAEELACVKKIEKMTGGVVHVVDMRSLGGMFEEEDATIPQRNMYLAMVAANMGYSEIHLVAQKDERSIPDRSLSFFRDASSLLTYLNGRPITVSTPFKDMDKVEMVRWYIDNLKDMRVLEETWACYKPVRVGFHKEPCGNCPACFRRFNALILNGYHEKWFFRLKDSEAVKEYYLRAKCGTYYSSERSSKILAAVKMLNEVKLPPTN